ncbi:MAG: hypothetical protein ABSB11_06765 [Sedimentisphaerales bacterium]|jgi:hypothetical protein
MKMIVSLLGILTALCFAGCVVERHEPARTVVVAQPPVVEVPYDDPGRGWYIEGYYTPAHVWVAPFWTVDIEVVHSHFDHYRGAHRSHFEEHFKQHPEKSDDRGNEHHDR